MEEIQELAIGEEGVIDGVKVRCVEVNGVDNPCDKCFASEDDDLCGKYNCLPFERADGKDVIYQEVK